MTRRLLPYEHQLVETLGISQEEYLEFLALQKEYSDPKIGTTLDIRNVEWVALGLTVIGTLLQVGAALLAPTPEAPRAKNQRRQREERFAPTYGFSSAQELANYGDPINLVYCNSDKNPRGAVRVATSLVWSAIESNGTSQFMQLLMVLGASEINAVNFARTAFGDIPLDNFSAANTWAYYRPNGAPLINNRVRGNSNDPAARGRDGDDAICLIQGDRTGCSQAFSPNNFSQFGVFDPIPINVKLNARRPNGDSEYDINGIEVANLSASNSYYWITDNRYKAGDEIRIRFRKLNATQKLVEGGGAGLVATKYADTLRKELVERPTLGAIYELGSARLELVSVGEQDIKDEDVIHTFRVVNGGLAPAAPYNKTEARGVINSDSIYLTEAQREKVQTDIAKLQSSAQDSYRLVRDGKNGSDTSGRVGNRTQNPNLGLLYFDEDAADIADEKIKATVQTEGIEFNLFGVNYSFTNNASVVSWVSDDGQNKTALVNERGSIAYTRKLLRQFLSNKPKIASSDLREYLNDQLVRLQTHVSNVASGKFDNIIRAVTSTSLSWTLQDNTQYTVIFSLAASGISKANGFIFDGDTTPRTPKEQIDEVRARYKTTINELEARIDDAPGKSNATFRDDLRKQIEDLRENRRDAVRSIIDSYRDARIQQARDAINSFVDVNSINRITGIRELRRRINAINGKNTTDQAGVAAVQAKIEEIIALKQEALEYLKLLRGADNIRDGSDVLVKALVKLQVGAYQTISKVNFVQFSIKARLFRRISGRQPVYGTNNAKENGIKSSDNGIKPRVAFFKVLFRKEGETDYTAVPYLFAVKNAQDREIFLNLKFQAATYSKYGFRFVPVGDFVSEMNDQGFSQFAFIEMRGNYKEININGNTFSFIGRFVNKNAVTGEPDINEGVPYGTQPWDLMTTRTDTEIQFSFEQGPEFAISAVTEQQNLNTSGYYQDMSTLALGVYSGQGVQDLRSITALVTKGKTSYVINGPQQEDVNLSTDSTSYAPDIFLDTIWSQKDGILNYSSRKAIDYATLFQAKRYCIANELFMDCVISEQRPWREFWAEVASYSLLDLVRRNGREALAPALPVDANNVITREIAPTGLFTTANILEGTLKEEHFDYGSAVQNMIMTVIYREVERDNDVFSPKASVTVCRRDIDEATALRQTVDLSQYVSSRDQAIKYAKYQVNQRQFIRRGIEFKTLPTEVPIAPGSYVLVDIGLTPWDNLTTGIVLEGGALNSPLLDKIPDSNSYTALLYKDGAVETVNSLTVSNGVASSLAPRYVGYAFVLGAPIDQSKRSYRVTEVALDEEGEITVKAVQILCDIGAGNKLLSRVADLSDSSFKIV